VHVALKWGKGELGQGTQGGLRPIQNVAKSSVLDEYVRHLRLAPQSIDTRERYIHADRWIGAMEKTSPLRIAWAEDDPIANIESGRELAKRLPRAEFVEWAGVGHFPNFEDPDFVANQIAISAGL